MTEYCQWVEKEGDEEFLCDRRGTETVTVRQPTMVAEVKLCRRHKAEHDQAAARMRTEKRRKQRESAQF